MMGHVAFEQLTLLAAELVAFIWKDSTKSTYDALHRALSPNTEASEGESEDSEAERISAAAGLFVWAAALVLFGLLFLAAGRWARESLGTSEQVGEGMADVDLDTMGLAIGWTLQASLNTFMLGPEW